MSAIAKAKSDFDKVEASLTATPQLCELRPGIGLCDQCTLPKWPQQYVGYGHMVCLDCLEKEKKGAK